MYHGTYANSLRWKIRELGCNGSRADCDSRRYVSLFRCEFSKTQLRQHVLCLCLSVCVCVDGVCFLWVFFVPSFGRSLWISWVLFAWVIDLPLLGTFWGYNVSHHNTKQYFSSVHDIPLDEMSRCNETDFFNVQRTHGRSHQCIWVSSTLSFLWHLCKKWENPVGDDSDDAW